MKVANDIPRANAPWYSGLTGSTWKTLFGSNIGWLFDGYETFALVLTVTAVMHSLLPPSALPRISFYQGIAVAATLLGWAFGGIIWGILTDYIGRKRAMVWSIGMYAVFTGLTFFSHTWWQFALFRFITGLGLGAEWATGASLVSETFPTRARAKGAAILQSGFGFGFLLAAIIWVLVSPAGAFAWRYMYIIGAVPGLIAAFYLQKNLPESERWSAMAKHRKQAQDKKAAGQVLTEDEEHLARFTLSEIFASRSLRRTVWLALGVSFAFTCGWWAVSTWIPAYAALVAKAAHLNPAAVGARSGIWYNVGGILGYLMFGAFADWLGRRITIAVYFALACLLSFWVFLVHMPPGTLMWAIGINGFFSLGVASVFPVLLPELFPTRVRATAAAFVFNASRFVAFLGPLVAGYLIAAFHGIPHIASLISIIFLLGAVVIWFLPETKGKPLPE